MCTKAKKALKKKMKQTSSSHLAISRRTNESSDFLALEGGPGRKTTPEEDEPVKNTAAVLYIGHIPHGFYEEQMEGFFKQFGKIKRLRIARNRKERTVEEYQHMIRWILKRDEKRGKRINAAGIEYTCPDLVGLVQPAAKKVKFDEE